MGAIEDIIKSLTTNMGVSNVTPFSKVVPFSNVVDPNLIKQFAQEQVNPDAYRQASQAYNNFMGSLYNTGGQRFGRMAGQTKLNALERARLDQLNSFEQAQQKNLQDFYTQQAADYYQDPNAFQINDFQTQVQNFTPKLNTAYNLNPGTYRPTFNYY